MTTVVMGIRVPTPDLDAGSLRMVRILKLLQELEKDVYFIPCRPFNQDPYGTRLDNDTRNLTEQGVRVLESPESLTGLMPPETGMVILSDEWVATAYLDAVRKCLPEATVVFDTVDLHHIRLYREAKFTRNRQLAMMAVQAQERERRAATKADITLTVSREEARILRTAIPEIDVRILPTIHPVSERIEPTFEDRAGLLFIGSFDHSPNRDAIAHLVDRLLPMIRAYLPGVPLTIAGARPPQDVVSRAPAGVSFRGFVPELIPLYDTARISVAPLRFGAGVKGKVLESMAHGLPVAGTPIAAEGLNAVDGIHMAIAEDDGTLAEKIAHLYQDSQHWLTIRNNGRELVKQDFSWERARQIVQSLVAGRNS